MTAASSQRIVTVICALLLTLPACSGANNSPAPTRASPPAQAITLTATPSTFNFALDNNTPESVTVTRSSGIFNSLAIRVSDPTVVGATAATLSGAGATFSVIPIAHGETTVTATDSTGPSTSVTVTTASCGRPPSLIAAQLAAPASGAAGVSAAIGKLYFEAYFVNGVGVSGNLHLIVGTHGTLEGGPLVIAALPPGTTPPTPLSETGTSEITVSATVPTLMAGQQYQTELYNDTCQQAVLAGTFST